MNGFSGVILNSNNFELYKKDTRILQEDILEYKFIVLKSHFIEKFSNDKIFEEDDEIIICVDGVILNFKDLREKYLCNSSFFTIKKMYKENSINFIKELRGNFSGVIHDKINGESYIFTNHVGPKPIYYFYDPNCESIVFSSQIKNVIKDMKKLGYNVQLSEIGAYFILTYGYMLEDFTLVNNVKRVKPGSYIKFKEGKLIQETYFSIDNENYICDSEEKMMSELYERFSHSIKKQFDKDIEYNYKHLSYISGGLDSRMIAFFAKELGYEELTMVNFGQSNCLDEKIAKRISVDLGYTFLYKSLDNGNFLRNISSIVNMNGGQNIYVGASHANSVNTIINWNIFGLLHNGNTADMMHGDYVDAPYHTKPSPEKWAYSNKLMYRISDINNSIASTYANQELFALYNRGINGMLNCMIDSQQFTESAEPFLYVDLIEYATRIHPKYKYGELLFLKMISKYMPEATKYKWERWNKRPTLLNFNIENNGVFSFFKRGFKYTKRKLLMQYPNNTMNPFDYWYYTNGNLMNFVDDNFKNNIYLLDNYPLLKKDSIELFTNGKFTEKAQVLTLLEAYYQILNCEDGDEGKY